MKLLRFKNKIKRLFVKRNRAERIKMTVTLDVTEPQALALEAMFKHWNVLASMGSSTAVAFYVDGDGNFKPKCKIEYSEKIRPLTIALAFTAICDPVAANRTYDFDNIAWVLRNLDERKDQRAFEACAVHE